MSWTFSKKLIMQLGKQSSFLLIAGLSVVAVIIIAFFGYQLIQGRTSETISNYDIYYREDCNSPFKNPTSYKFSFKKETSEIFMTVEFDKDGVRKQGIDKLEDCTILDSNNWMCGGKLIGGSLFDTKYQFIEGVFSYDPGYNINMCNVKIVKR